MAWKECVYDCRHPLWGGVGVCITEDDTKGSGTCSCDAGFASRDSFGRPSCVPKQALVAAYLLVAVSAVGVTANLMWHLARYRRLSASTKSTRRAICCLRSAVSLSFYTVGITSVFGTAAARGGNAALWDDDMFFIYHLGIHPVGIFSATQMISIWIDSLPGQVLSSGSAWVRAKKIEQTRDICFWVGCVAAAGILVFGSMSSIIGHEVIICGAIITCLVSATSLVIVVCAVAVRLTMIINAANAQVPQTWHGKAKKTLWQQARFIAIMGALYDACLLSLVLAPAGRRTPLIPYSMSIVVCMVGLAGIVHFSMPTVAVVGNHRTGHLPKRAVLSASAPPAIGAGECSSASRLPVFISGAGCMAKSATIACEQSAEGRGFG